jgi:hypothetical protein
MATLRDGASVVIATCDRPRSAAALVREVVGQRGLAGALEILVVNDAGDASVFDAVAEAAAGSGVPLRCFDTEHVSGFGVVLARNIGLRFARCATTIFLDDDVAVGRDLVARYQRAPEGLRLGRIDFAVELAGRQLVVPDRRDILHGADRAVEPVGAYLGYLWSANFALPTLLGLAIGGFDEAFLDENEEDMDFGARAMLAGRRLVAVPSARALHHGPDDLLRHQLGLPVSDRPRRAQERFARRGHLVVNGGEAYWRGPRWERFRRPVAAPESRCRSLCA